MVDRRARLRTGLFIFGTRSGAARLTHIEQFLMEIGLCQALGGEAFAQRLAEASRATEPDFCAGPVRLLIADARHIQATIARRYQDMQPYAGCFGIALQAANEVCVGRRSALKQIHRPAVRLHRKRFHACYERCDADAARPFCALRPQPVDDGDYQPGDAQPFVQPVGFV